MDIIFIKKKTILLVKPKNYLVLLSIANFQTLPLTQGPSSVISLSSLVQPILPRKPTEARPARDSHYPLSAPLADLQALERLLLPTQR